MGSPHASLQEGNRPTGLQAKTEVAWNAVTAAVQFQFGLLNLSAISQDWMSDINKLDRLDGWTQDAAIGPMIALRKIPRKHDNVAAGASRWRLSFPPDDGSPDSRRAQYEHAQ